MDRAPRLTRERLAVLAGLLMLAAYAAFLHHHTVFSVGGADSAGYLSATRALLEGCILRPIAALRELDLPTELDRLFIPLGSAPGGEPGTMVSGYPVGLPLHMGGAALLAGRDSGPFFVSPAAALGTLLLMYLLGRELALPPAWSLSGSAMLAVFPTFVYQAVQPMSNVVATFWAAASVWAALRARRRPAFAVLAGWAFAAGVLVRPTNVLLAVPLMFAVPRGRRAWGLFLAGAAGPAIVQIAYNVAAVGRPFTSGYGEIWTQLSPSHVPHRLEHYVRWTAALASPVVFLGWIGVAADRRVEPRNRWLLNSWFGVFLLFYSFYFVYDTWWYTRFLLPGIPAMILGALLVGRDLLTTEVLGWFVRRALAAAALVLVLATGARFIMENRVHKIYKGYRIYPRASRFVEPRLPARALVLSMQMSGALDYYTDVRYVMWNWLGPDRPPDKLVVSVAAKGYAWYALLAPFELPDARARFPGRWEELDKVGNFSLGRIDPKPDALAR